MAAVGAGSKRPRPEDWEECEDVPALRKMLAKQEEDLKKLKSDNSQLKKLLAAAEGQHHDSVGCCFKFQLASAV